MEKVGEKDGTRPDFAAVIVIVALDEDVGFEASLVGLVRLVDADSCR